MLNSSLRFSIKALVVLQVCVFGMVAAAQQPYQVVDHWAVGGAGGWDYLFADTSAHLLYLSHGPRVDVVDTTTGKVVGAITGLQRTHGIVVDDAGKFGYVSDSGTNAVVVFDRSTFKVVKTVAAGTGTDGMVFDPATKTVWAFNGRSKNVTVIDTATNEVVATIDVPGKPEFPVADGLGSVYDNIESENEIVRFDARAKKITATWKLTDCESPSGLAIDKEHRKLFAVCDGKKMAVVDADSGKQLASPGIGDGPDAAGFSAKYQLAFSSNGAGMLSVIDTKTYKTVEELATAKGARTMSYDEKMDRVYLVTAKFGAAPEATAAVPHPRPTAVDGSFEVVVVGRK
jgi:YVTN family beta-propeller protein